MRAVFYKYALLLLCAIPLAGLSQEVHIRNLKSLSAVAVFDQLLLTDKIGWRMMRFENNAVTIDLETTLEQGRLERALTASPDFEQTIVTTTDASTRSVWIWIGHVQSHNTTPVHKQPTK